MMPLYNNYYKIKSIDFWSMSCSTFVSIYVCELIVLSCGYNDDGGGVCIKLVCSIKEQCGYCFFCALHFETGHRHTAYFPVLHNIHSLCTALV